MDFNKYDPLKEQNQGEKAMTCGVDVTKDATADLKDMISRRIDIPMLIRTEGPSLSAGPS